MEKYNIYAGLTGSFGGATYQGTGNFKSEDDAYQVAYECAVEEYQSYEGLHGIRDWNDCFEDFCEKEGIEPTSDNESKYLDEIELYYEEEMESWIEYYPVLFDEDKDLDPDEYFEMH